MDEVISYLLDSKDFRLVYTSSTGKCFETLDYKVRVLIRHDGTISMGVRPDIHKDNIYLVSSVEKDWEHIPESVRLLILFHIDRFL
jgi:hypothetical protein